jgi:hypothetical protein
VSKVGGTPAWSGVVSHAYRFAAAESSRSHAERKGDFFSGKSVWRPGSMQSLFIFLESIF